jgi:putative protease
MAEEKLIGEVTHYFDHLGVAVFKLTAVLNVGDKIHLKGHTTDFEQSVKEMQVDHANVEKAAKGAELGVKVDDVVREGDKIYLV